MRSMKSDGDIQMPPKEQLDSSSNDEGSWSGSTTAGEEVVLKKGPWTSAEDAMLIDFVDKNGEGNWNAVQRNTGLRRCGKSCRLRWANHLRPDLKKVALTREEEQIIVQLHAKIGNKWAQMAALLPGRTDNEIKNFWNTRTKRRHRAGLPLYPASIACSAASDENQMIQSSNEFSHGDSENSGVLEKGAMYEMPNIEFNPRKTTTIRPVSYAPPLPDLHSTSIRNQGFGPYYTRCFLNQGFNPINLNTEPAACFPGYPGGLVSTFKEPRSERCELMYRNLGLSYSYDPDPDDNKNLLSFGCSVPGGHASSYGNFSASMKLELPSLQCPETNNHSNWMSPPYYVHVPPDNGSFLFDCASPRSDGLLDALVHQSLSMSCGKKQSSEKSSCSSAVTLGDMMESTAVNFAAEWEEISDQRSVDELSLITTNSFDELPPKPPSGSEETMAVEQGSTTAVPEKEASHWPDFLRPDDFFQLQGEDSSAVSLDSCPWNSMPPIYQMSEDH